MVNILSNLIFFTWLTHDSSFSLTKLWQKSYIVLPASRDHRWSISTNEKCTIFTYMLLWQKQYKIDTVKYILVIKNHMWSTAPCYCWWFWVTFECHFSYS